MFAIISKHLITSLTRITIRTRYYSTKYIPNSSAALIAKLSKCGRIDEARKVFDETPERDVMTWMAAINGYVKCGLVEEARELFDSVEAKKDVVTWTVMLNGYVRSRRIGEAERLFLEMPEKNVVSWNTMIEGYAKNGLVDAALELFERTPERNAVTWNVVVAGLSRSGRVDEARRLFDSMPYRNVVSWTTMVSGLLKNGRLDDARRLFEAMPEKNSVSWNAMIDGLVRSGEIGSASKVFDEMPRRDSGSWTKMVVRYEKRGESEEALKTFSKMAGKDNTRPNEATFASALVACGNLAGLNEGRQVHQAISKSVHLNSAILASALINMYSKCGDLSDAKRVFHELPAGSRDLIAWNAMISAYSHHGLGSEAIGLFEEIRALGFRPTGATYVALLSACSHAGLVGEGLGFFDELVRDDSIRVNEKHCSCYVDLCGRAGQLGRAFDFIRQLEIGTKPSAVIWGALLAGCNVYGDSRIGNLAARKVLEAGEYSLLSSVYASAQKWKEVAEVRRVMKEKGLKKQPGCSWIRAGDAVRVFVAGDHSSPCRPETLCSLLSDLHKKMRVGFVSNHGITLNEDF